MAGPHPDRGTEMCLPLHCHWCLKSRRGLSEGTALRHRGTHFVRQQVVILKICQLRFEMKIYHASGFEMLTDRLVSRVALERNVSLKKLPERSVLLLLLLPFLVGGNGSDVGNWL